MHKISILIASISLIASSPLFAAIGQPLPKAFTSDVQGQNDKQISVTITQVNSSLEKDAILENFASTFSLGFIPKEVIVEAAVYKISNPNHNKFWIGSDSSIGITSEKQILNSLFTALGEEGDCYEPTRENTVDFLLGPIKFANLEKAAKSLKDLYLSLNKEYANHTSGQGLYNRVCLVSEIATSSVSALFIDPTPNAGPDTDHYLVVFKTGSEE